MALTGLKRPCKRLPGGILEVGLIEADNLTDATVDASNEGALSAVTLKAGAYFEKYEFKEDTASFTEQVAENGAVTSNVIFDPASIDSVTRNALQELIDASACGLIGAVKLPSGEKIIVGYTDIEKKARPLRVSTIDGTTGATIEDAQSENTTLTRKGGIKAMYYTGEWEALFEPATP